MTEVIKSGDCGNSPKNQLVQRLVIALAIGDVEAADQLLADEATWTIAGGREYPTRSDILAHVNSRLEEPPARVEVHHVLSHGWTAAANGLVKRHNGNDVWFCVVVVFSNARGAAVRQITSYDIEP